MNLEELFQKGVTPLSGYDKGRRFLVLRMDRQVVYVREWDSMKECAPLRHGTYKIWEDKG